MTRPGVLRTCRGGQPAPGKPAAAYAPGLLAAVPSPALPLALPGDLLCRCRLWSLTPAVMHAATCRWRRGRAGAEGIGPLAAHPQCGVLDGRVLTIERSLSAGFLGPVKSGRTGG
jgi:hypothetical protein